MLKTRMCSRVRFDRANFSLAICLRRALVLVLAIGCVFGRPLPAQAEAPEVEWVRQFAGLNPARDGANAVDAEGNVYVASNISVQSITDRTPYPQDLATAYEAVESMKRLPEGHYQAHNKESQLDHSQLSSFIRSADGHRDLSATVSCLNEVVKDLVERIKLLERANDQMEKLQKQNNLLEQRLAKLEALINH